MKLSNGLTLAVQQDNTIPLVTMDMWVRVGSGDEPSEIAGASHFLEHMLFKGTERLPVGEYDRRVEGAGGYLNAATSYDYTHYYVTVPSEHFEAILEDFADVMTGSSIATAEVESERQVILEEIRRKNDNAMGFLFDEAMPALYGSGPYRHTVLGSSETVAAISRDTLAEHYRRFYTADNMYLSVVGAVDPEAVRARAELAFSRMNTTRAPWRDAAPGTNFAAPASRLLPREWNEAYFLLAFPGPAAGATARDMALADLAQTVLGGGRSSRLVKSLQEQKGIVSSIGAYLPTNRNPGPITIYGTCEPERLDEVRTEIFNELSRLREGGLKGDEMKRVRRLALNSHLFSLESNAGRASTAGYSLAMLGNLSLLTEYEDLLRSIGESEVEDFLRKWLVEESASFVVTARPERVAPK